MKLRTSVVSFLTKKDRLKGALQQLKKVFFSFLKLFNHSSLLLIDKNNAGLVDDELDNCVFDACLVKENRQDMICKSVEDFADKCREKYDITINWRSQKFCRMFLLIYFKRITINY